MLLLKDNYDNLLPLGSICKLKDNDLEIMVCGYFCANNDSISTYAGTIYPVGIITEKKFLPFNAEDIEEVIFRGYSNELFAGFVKGINLGIKDAKEELASEEE